MPLSSDRLQRIRRFPDLLGYLRDELDWPTEDFAFDDLTFAYEPAELGLKDEEALKVKTIHQLRPLHQAQPWGIFFVEFGKKRIPIVVLRRILRHLVLSAYNKQLKIQRGVFYTPQPVVSYIVRSVHELLQTEFGLADGLASTVTWGEMIARSPGRVGVPPKPSNARQPRLSQKTFAEARRVPQDAEHGLARPPTATIPLHHLGGHDAHPTLKLPPLTDEPGEKRTISPDEPFVQILDPATGTATFLVEVIEVIHKHLDAQWKKGGLAAMPVLPAVTATAARSGSAAPSEQAGGLSEISRGSSEPGERTPQDAEKQRTHPGGARESHARAAVPAPRRGAARGGGGPGVSPPANFQQPSGLPAPRTFAGYWNQYVPAALLPRLHAFELMMAPYAIAHMKIGLKLAETGYRFGTEERGRIYLTNALEPKVQQLPQIGFDALAHEAAAVNEIKWYKRFTVVIGNPPYSPSICEPEWLMRRLDDWKQGLNETKSDLNREEWKFLRLAQHHCRTTGAGIIGFIINRDFLDGIVKRRMREHLGQSFPLRIAVDLNGDVKGNISDENVFEIEQGVTIAVLCTKSATKVLRFASRVGTRAQKYADLVAKKPIDAALTEFEPARPACRFGRPA